MTQFRSIFGVVLGLLLVLSFNNCSGVKFADVPLESNGSNNIKDIDGNDDDDYGNCPQGNCNIVDHNETKTVTVKTNKIDILLVVDNSASMKKENAEMSARLNGMVGILETAGASWQMCYITTHVVQNGNAGRILDWKNKSGGSVVNIGSRVLSNSTSDKENVFKTTMANIALGMGNDGSGTEQGIAATRIAVTETQNNDCFRNDAAFTVIYLSDEDEKSCGGRCQTASEEPGLQSWATKYYTDAYSPLSSYNQGTSLIAHIESLWPDKAFTAHAIVIKKGDKACWQAQDDEAVAFYGIELGKLQKATGGVLGNICAASYSSQLTNIATRTLDTLGSISLKCLPIADPVVTITPANASVSVTRTGNKLFFTPALVSGTQVNVQYQCYE